MSVIDSTMQAHAGWGGRKGYTPPNTSQNLPAGISLSGAAGISSGNMNALPTSGLLSRSLFRGTDVKKGLCNVFLTISLHCVK